VSARRLRVGVLAALLVLLAGFFGNTAPASAAGPATRTDVINYFRSISGNSTLSGQQDGPSSAPNTWQQKVHDITGVYPGVWGGDFAFEQTDINARPAVIAQAKAVWAAGSIPALVWHACPPTVATTCHWDYGTGAIESKLTDAQWTSLITNGSALNTAWKKRLDEAVPFLQDLLRSGVPVLFRPIHEMNEGWSWWGGRPGANGSRRLYQITKDYYDSLGLTNLVWVWNVKDITGGAAHLADYWPGASYVDLATLDIWSNRQPTQEYYNAMLAIAGDKPIGMAENGTVPTPETLRAQPRWTYFSIWIGWLTDPAWNPDQNEIKRTYYDGRVLNRGEISIGGSGPVAGKIRGVASGKCADVAGASPVNGTAVQLYTCDSNGTAQAWTMSSDGTVRALAKCLDVTGGVAADGTKVQIWDCTTGNPNQQWRYNAATQTLTNPATGRCLDATGQGTADGTRLQIWSCNGHSNQRWTVP
jgi:mannan endo-1,4-beta-mannosidase